MRIAFDAKRAFNNTTGLGNYSRTLIAALCTNHAANDFFLFTPKVNDALSETFLHNAKIVLPEKINHKLFPFFWRSFGIGEQIRQSKIDVFHGLSNELPFNSKGFHCKKVVTIHDLLFAKHPEDFPEFDRSVYALKVKCAVKNADAITVSSMQTKEDLMDFFGVSELKINVTPLAISSIFFEKKSIEKIDEVLSRNSIPPNFLLQPGSFLGRKNHQLSIAAFEKLSAKFTDLFLVFTGVGGNLEKQLLKQIASLNLTRKILFRKNVRAEDMPAIYQAASLVLYPSLNEGFGLPILEAFASEIPVITSNDNVFKETGGDAAFYIDNKSVSALETAVELLITNRTMRSDLIEKGKQQLSNFSAEVLAQRMMKLYESL